MSDNLVRPVRCHFCNRAMFYSGQVGHEPEVHVEIQSYGSGREKDKFSEFYAHVSCWNKAIGNPTEPEKNMI